jgi:hypothetical protein
MLPVGEVPKDPDLFNGQTRDGGQTAENLLNRV